MSLKKALLGFIIFLYQKAGLFYQKVPNQKPIAARPMCLIGSGRV